MLVEDTEGFTQLALDKVQGHGLYVQFYMKPVQDNEATLKEGRPIFDEKEYIKIMVPGDKANVAVRPVRFGHSPQHDNVKFNAEYQQFLAGKEQTPDGTPLKEWPMISQSQVLELAHFNVQTIEQLAAMSDSTTQKFMGLSLLKNKANEFLNAAKENVGTVQLKAELDERDTRLAAQQKQIDEMSEKLNAMAEPKKRGRPPKEA